MTDENGSNEYTAVIEKEENNYRIKSIINNFTINKMVYLIIKNVNGNEDLHYKCSILGQFFDINKNTILQLSSNECIISDTDCIFVFNLSILASNLVLSIIKSNFPNEIPTKNYNIILNIKNTQLNKLDTNIYFIETNSRNPFKLELVKRDNKIKLIGNYLYKSSLIIPTCYSPILENYFNIIGSRDELINTDGITSSSGKPKKFGFMRYNNKPNIYTLIIANQDGSEIETNEIITFDLTPDKNAEVEVKEKVIETVQDAIEALSDSYNGDFDSEPTDPTPEPPEETNIYTFEKTTLSLEMNGETQTINSDIIEDVSNLSLIKNSDGTIYLKGSLTLKTEGTAVIKINKTISGLNKRNFIALSYRNPVFLYPYYKDNYIYIILSTTTKEIEAEANIGNIKIYDNNIIAPIDPKYSEYLGAIMTEYFGIYLVNGKYRLKGSADKVYDSMIMGFVDYDTITQFFNVTNQYLFYEDDNLLIRTEGGFTINSVIPILIKFKNNNYTVDIECPLQPSI
ncbi:peptidase [Brachyspira hyodysenteriae]|nr:peptidase [Brachyspira hyodysenteriae]MDA0072769.1 peptidase [Brachyspira hyodysenteriae]